MTTLPFSAFRVKAKSLSDVQQWIFANAQVNTQGELQYTDPTECTIVLKSLGFRKDVHNPKDTWMHCYVTVRLSDNRAYKGKLPVIPGVLVMEREASANNELAANILLPAVEWPFVAAALLFKLRKTSNAHEQELETFLLERCFPELPVEVYASLLDTELVSLDEVAFCDWLMQAGIKENKVSITVELPQSDLC